MTIEFRRFLPALAAAVLVPLAAGAAFADGPGNLKFDESSFEVIEEAGTLVITVERSQGEDGAVSVDYATADGSATAGADYQPASGTLSWGAGDGTSRTFTLTILDDADAEGAETVQLALSNPTGGAGIDPDRGTSVAVILASDGGTGGDNPGDDGPGDDDGPGVLKFDEDSIVVLEEAGVALVAVERSQGEAGAVSVDYATADGTATAGADYTAVSGTLSWAAGDGSTKTFMVPILDDSDAEPSETIALALSNPTGGAGIDPQRGDSTLIIAASDGGTGGPGDDGPGDDGPGDDNGDGEVGIFKFDQRDFLAVENAGVAVISVERSQGETGAASVDYSTADGTATAGADYTAASGTLSWAAGEEGSKVFTVPIADDDLEEGAETVVLTLSNPTGGAGLDNTRATAVLTLVDDDQGNGVPAPGDDDRPGTLKFSSSTFQVFEGGATATIGVERSRGAAGTVSVEYAATAGSATDGLDFEATSGVLTWGPGDGGSRTFTVTVFDDDLFEGNESVLLALANPTGGAGIDAVRGTAGLTILDDDGTTAACDPSANDLCLAGGRFKASVEWRTPQGGVGAGRVIPVSDRSGLVWFFREENVEMLVKVLDACQDFGNYWVFFAATTNVDFTLTVTDTASGAVKQYSNPMGQPAAPVQDTFTFTGCP